MRKECAYLEGVTLSSFNQCFELLEEVRIRIRMMESNESRRARSKQGLFVAELAAVNKVEVPVVVGATLSQGRELLRGTGHGQWSRSIL